MSWWQPPDDMDPAEVAEMMGIYDKPWDPDHFLTPVERALVSVYKARPVRMRRFLKELRWVTEEVKKRGVEL